VLRAVRTAILWGLYCGLGRGAEEVYKCYFFYHRIILKKNIVKNHVVAVMPRPGTFCGMNVQLSVCHVDISAEILTFNMVQPSILVLDSFQFRYS
jgi:hypothetical protein